MLTSADLETVLADPLKFVSGELLSSRGKYLVFLDVLSRYRLMMKWSNKERGKPFS